MDSVWEEAECNSESNAGVKRRRLLALGTWATAVTGMSTLAGFETKSAHAAPPAMDQPNVYIPVSEKGKASGVATLDESAKIPSSQLPNLSATVLETIEATSARRVDRAWLASSGIPQRPSIIKPDEWQGDRAPAKLSIPTYDGSDQTVHPDVFHAPDGWGSDANGKAWKWWMVHTPYPFSKAIFENPSIVVSDDGQNWFNPPGLTNPIVPQPLNGGYCSDGELTQDKDGTLYLTYRWVRNSDEIICWRSSVDGVNWSAEVEMIRVKSAGNDGIVSPTIAYDAPTRKWRMWAGREAAPNPIIDMRIADNISGPWSDPVPCTTPLPTAPQGTDHDLWHLDVISYGGQYVMLAATQTEVGQRFLYLGVSVDGLVWRFGKRPIIARGGGSRWDSNPYRGCFVPVATAAGNTLRVYYSASGPAGWGVGVTEIRPNPLMSSRMGDFGPDDHGFLAWTNDPILAVGGSNSLSSGSVAYVLIRVAIGGYVGEINAQVTTAGASLTAGQNFWALYDLTGNKLGQTADVSSKLGSTGGKGFPLIAPTRYLEAGELIYVGYLFNGTSAPKFAGMANPVAAGFGRNAVPGSPWFPPRAGKFGSALTSLPDTVSGVSGEAWFPWVALTPSGVM